MASDVTPLDEPKDDEPKDDAPKDDGPEHPAPERRHGPSTTVLVSLLVAGALVMLAFAPASRLAARGLRRVPRTSVTVVTGADRGVAAGLRTVPAGLPAGARIRTAADVYPFAVAALGTSGAAALMDLLNSKSSLSGTLTGYNVGKIRYPYQYPPLEAVLNRAPPASLASAGTALGAALTVLAAQPQDSLVLNTGAITNAAPAAYGVLNRARAAGGCAAQLDLLLLLTSDEVTVLGGDPVPAWDHLSQEEQRTEQACPRDPTAGWLVGEAQLREVIAGGPESSGAPYVITALRASHATFSRLAAEYPRDPGVLTGLGDSDLRAGTYLRSTEPFTARQDFLAAVAAYNRASALGDERDAAPGLARALIGLGQPGRAARLLAPLARSAAYPGQFLELIIDADEAAHDFGPAAAVAQQLERRGSGAYPDGDALIPVALPFSVDALDDASLPLSLGAGRFTPLDINLVPPGGAGGAVTDVSFIPEYRDDNGVTGSQPTCPSWTWARDELIAGHAAVALAHWPAQLTNVRPGGGDCNTSDQLKLMAETQAGQKPDPTTMKSDQLTSDDLADDWQNLLRWGGNLTAARRAVESWQAARGDHSALPALRLGEIDFLTHDDNDAAAEFGLAARRDRLVDYNDDLAPDQAELDRGAALLAAGRPAEAVPTLRPLDLIGTQGYAYQNSAAALKAGQGFSALDFAVVSYYACEQLADHESETGNLHAAVEDYANALDWVPDLQEQSSNGLRPEALTNNAALAYLALGATGTATGLEKKALAADPQDPVFLMTAGYIAERAGQRQQAIRYDRLALASDPGAFPAANDLAVELTRQHHDGEAAGALEQAVGADPRYALGWFNLGVLESGRGPAHLLEAQGAFAVAFSLDPALKSRQHTMTIDASVYRTALDLSKPLPPSWSISQLPQPVPAAAVGLLALGLLALGLARATGHGGSVLAAQWLDPLSDRLQSAPLLRRLRHPGWSLVATAATFLLAYLRKGAGPTEIVSYVAGVLVLALLAVGARVLLARRLGTTATQVSWPPGLAFGVVAGAVGLPWAPLPVVRAEGEGRTKVHLAAPISLAALSALLFLESAWLHTPITESWAVAALIMSASALLPVGPLDGAQLGKAGVLAATGVVGGALLVGLGLI